MKKSYLIKKLNFTKVVLFAFLTFFLACNDEESQVEITNEIEDEQDLQIFNQFKSDFENFNFGNNTPTSSVKNAEATSTENSNQSGFVSDLSIITGEWNVIGVRQIGDNTVQNTEEIITDDLLFPAANNLPNASNIFFENDRIILSNDDSKLNFGIEIFTFGNLEISGLFNVDLGSDKARSERSRIVLFSQSDTVLQIGQIFNRNNRIVYTLQQNVDGDNQNDDDDGGNNICDNFTGVNQGNTANLGQIAFVSNIGIVDPSTVVWTIDGVTVTPRNLRFIALRDHLSQAATVEVCYRSVSQNCGVLEACLTIDFQP